MIAIRCGQCGFENDSSRKFCQNCGTRLELAESVPGSRKPVKKSQPPISHPRKSPSRGVFGILLIELFWTAVLAAILAAMVQAIRVPDAIPPVVTANPQLASLLKEDIQAAKENAYPRTLEITQEAANNFLATRIQGIRKTGSGLRARFMRAFVMLESGTIKLGVEQRLKDFPVYLQLSARPFSNDSGTTLVLTGGSIGRLKIPRQLAPLFARSFEGVMINLNAPLSWFSTATSVQLTTGSALVTWPGSARE